MMPPLTSPTKNGRKTFSGKVQSSPLRSNNLVTDESKDPPKHYYTYADSFRRMAAPVSLVGGTAAIYAHLKQQHTPISLLYIVLLAVHYAIQPKLSKRYISKKTSSQSVALAEEVTKSILAAAFFATTKGWPPSVVNHSFRSTLTSSLAVAGLPAVLYAIQGVLQYQSYRYLDAVTYNGLSQIKTFTAAFWCWILLGKQQTPRQMVALAVLFYSSLLFQKQQNSQSNNYFVRGIVPCLLATCLSGLAGALSQKGLQFVGETGKDPYLYALEVSFYSALTLLVTQRISLDDLFRGWTWKTLFPVLCKAAGGILTVLVHKHTGTVSKGFALVFGLVLSGVIESMYLQTTLPWHQFLGTLLVMLSGWMHFSQIS